MLKSDFHTHAGIDIDHKLDYSPKKLIDVMAGMGYEVLSITNHDRVTYSRELSDYAKKRGILLIPGIEKKIENKEVIIINATKKAESIRTFSDLEQYRKGNNIFVMAPHPFYPERKALHSRLIENIKLFDGIEFCHFYLSWWTYNKKAVEIAKDKKLSLIGTSDCHMFDQLNRTYTMLDAKKNISSVLDALRKGKDKIITEPLPLFKALKIITLLYFKY